MQRVFVRLLAVAVLGCAASVASWAGMNALYEAEWQDGPDQGTQSLRLEFQFLPPDLEVSVTPRGVSLWLAGVEMEELPVEGVSLVREEGGSRILIDRRGAVLRSVRLDGGTVMLEVAGFGAAGPALGTGYRIGAGDVVRIAVYKNEDLSGDFTVAPDGTVTLPLIGPVSALGLTEAELKATLTDSLAADYLVDPQVSVSVATYRSQYAYVTGSVGRASRVSLEPGMTMKDVLSEAAIALLPGQKISITRTGIDGETLVFEAGELDAETAPVPRDGDVLTVQERNYVFIQGEVRRPQRLVHDPKLTLLQAIAMAEGLTDWASRKDVLVRRPTGDTTENFQINLKRVEEGRDPDPTLRPGDVIVVRRRVL